MDKFIPALDSLLKDVNINIKKSFLEERGEDSFVYSLGLFNVDVGEIYTLTLNQYVKRDPNINYFSEFMNTPYQKIAKYLKRDERNKCFLDLNEYITHFDKNFVIKYSLLKIEDNCKEQALDVISKSGIHVMDNDLAKALSDPKYMDGLCKYIGNALIPKFKV